MYCDLLNAVHTLGPICGPRVRVYISGKARVPVVRISAMYHITHAG